MKIRWPGFDAETVAAIEEWLDLDGATEIIWREGQGDGADRWDRGAVERRGVYRYVARGRSIATNHSRSMIDLIEHGVSSAMAGATRPSCPACDDWSRTAKCDVHPELSLEEHQWQRGFDRHRVHTEFGPEPDPSRAPAAVTCPPPPPVTSEFRAALESFRNQYRYGFEVRYSGVSVWTIDTGA